MGRPTVLRPSLLSRLLAIGACFQAKDGVHQHARPSFFTKTFYEHPQNGQAVPLCFFSADLHACRLVNLRDVLHVAQPFFAIRLRLAILQNAL